MWNGQKQERKENWFDKIKKWKKNIKINKLFITNVETNERFKPSNLNKKKICSNANCICYMYTYETILIRSFATYKKILQTGSKQVECFGDKIFAIKHLDKSTIENICTILEKAFIKIRSKEKC